jgi:uncharacterized protein
MEQYRIVKNAGENRFETTVEGHTAYLDFRQKNGVIYLVHTFVPEPIRGRNVADQLARFALDFIKSQGLETRIYCEFIAIYVKRNKKYEDFIEKIAD